LNNLPHFHPYLNHPNSTLQNHRKKVDFRTKNSDAVNSYKEQQIDRT
jgi:hypothetical protein